jgi:hypothetical protein
MSKFFNPALSFFLICVLVSSLTVSVSASDDRERIKPLRLYANEMTGPLGRIDSIGLFAVDGRTLAGEQVIWGGETIHTTRGTARVSMEHIGKMMITNGSIVKLSRTMTTFDDETGGELLIASIVRGEAKFNIEANAAVYVEAGGSAYRSSRGASFSVDMRSGEPSITTSRGEIQSQADPSQRRYRLRPVGVGANISVRARATRQIQVQVTDENDRPVPDVPIIFALGSGGSGSIGGGAAASATVTTNAQGIASTSFTAGSTQGSNSLTATISGTNTSLTFSVTIGAAGALTASTITVLVMTAVGGTLTGIGIARDNNDDRNGGLTPLPPDITPRGR